MLFSPRCGAQFTRWRRAAVVLVIVLVLGLGVGAQSGKKRQKLRAIAVLEWQGDPAKPEARKSILMPIAVYDGDRYNDASIYYASPVPMAVDGGVEYDVLRTGVPLGTFDVGSATQNAAGRWFGLGTFSAPTVATDETAKSQIEVKTPEGKVLLPEKKGKQEKQEKQDKSASKDKKSDSSDSSAADKDPDRPRIRRGPPSGEPTVMPSINEPPTTPDPDRPKLQRSKPGEDLAHDDPRVALNVLQQPDLNIAVAVSDQAGQDARPYKYELKPDELEKYQAELLKIAEAELAKHPVSAEMAEGAKKQQEEEEPAAPLLKRKAAGATAAPAPKKPATKAAPKRAPAKPAAKAAAKPTAPQFTDVQLRAYDLNTNNAPLMVLTAKTAAAPAQYVTVAAWLEVDLTMRTIFRQVTDKQHLDVYPWLETIDAVDADGDGRGDLLFRAHGDRGSRFVLYHAGPDSLELLFDPDKS